MSDQGSLFDRKAADPQPTLTVSAFNSRVEGLLRGAFASTIRIRGVVSSFKRSYARGSHVYFELLEKDPGDDSQVVAQISMVIWRGSLRGLRAGIEELGGSSGDLDDQEVVFEASVNFWAKGGRLSLVVKGVDVEASLGARKLDRERILRALKDEGLLDRNRAVPLPVVPLRLGLITSVESAAYHDFLKELGQRGIGFRVFCRDARVQGEDMEHDILGALKLFADRAADFDALVMIRGGGSRSDLIGFDNEKIARAICAHPLPLLTGIGHEIDRSVADEVAHRSLKTPTAAAQYLVERVESFDEQMEGAATAIRRAAERQMEKARRLLGTRARDIRSALLQRVSRMRLRLGKVQARLPAAARRRPGLAASKLAEARRRLLRLAPAQPGKKMKLLQAAADSLRLLDPSGLLARGYSITRDEKGRVLRSVDDLSSGQGIETTLADGSALSQVTEIKNKGES